MRRPFSSRFLGMLAAGAVAFTTLTAVPVYADDARTARVLATILGIAIVGKIIHDDRKDKKEKQQKKGHKPKIQQPAQSHRHGNLTHRHDRGRLEHDHGYAKPDPRPLPQRVDRKVLPKNCFRSYQTYDGPAYMFGRHCLERSYEFVNRLPQTCAQRIRTPDGNHRGYDARCLRRNGYSLARG